MTDHNEKPATEAGSAESCCSAAECYTTGSQYGRIYGRLHSMRVLATELLSESSPPLQIKDHDELVRLRDQINRVIGMVIDSSKRDASRMCR